MITIDQAYLAMCYFLEGYYQRGKSEELGVLLGSMSLLTDGIPADPAIAEDWAEAVNKEISAK